MWSGLHKHQRFGVLFISLFGVLMTFHAQAIEEPGFTVERAWEEEQIEIRAYAPRIMAVTAPTRR